MEAEGTLGVQGPLRRSDAPGFPSLGSYRGRTAGEMELCGAGWEQMLLDSIFGGVSQVAGGVRESGLRNHTCDGGWAGLAGEGGLECGCSGGLGPSPGGSGACRVILN